MFKQSVSTFILLLSFFTGLQGIAKRLSIFEKPMPSGVQRVILYYDQHYPNKALAQEQARTIVQSCQQPNSILLLESAPPDQFVLQEKVYTLTQISNTYLPQAQGMAEAFGKPEDTLIFQLNQNAKADSTKFLDKRAPLLALQSLTTMLVELPFFKRNTKYYNYIKQQIPTFNLSVEQFWASHARFFEHALITTQNLRKLVKDKVTRKMLDSLLHKIEQVGQLIAVGQEQFAPYNELPWAQLIFDQAQDLYNQSDGIIQARDLSSDVLGEAEYLLMNYLQAGTEETNLLFDIFVLAEILSPSAPRHVCVVAGFVHGDTISEMLLRQGYTLLYDSGFILTNGEIIPDSKTLLEEVSMEYGHLPTAQKLEKFYAFIKPLSSQELGHAQKSRKELEEHP